MMPRPPIATYRIQLRGGVDFAAVQAQIGYLAQLGVSHLYLSPIFSASSGSTHGYDVIDPTEIDPVLGGRHAFESLVVAARAAGLGIILDIVPNHTSFTLDNPWLRQVLVDGQRSSFAPCFDIDWTAGPLILPILPQPFEKMLAENRFSVDDSHLVFDNTRVPLRPGTALEATGAAGLRRLHESQHWRLRHWQAERDSITHRRFFNVTGLIGMRVEDPEVFDATHALVIDLVRSGLVDGLRIDHIDGLADPAAYLDRLATILPGTPVWVEKILVGEEELPARFKTVGTTGYEAARLLACGLTSPAGLDRLDAVWRKATGDEEDFAEALRKAKREILENELAAELHQLIALAGRATARSMLAEPGPETLREALVEMLSAMPRYRTYIEAEGASDHDRALIAAIADDAKSRLRSGSGVEALAEVLANPRTPDALRLAVRFQQVSGALLAKAQEDTAGFRWTRYLAANEVGAEPQAAVMGEQEAEHLLGSRTPWSMTLTSTHDTKRSEDARMRLVAISHDPQAFAALFAAASGLQPAGPVAPRWRWYIVQSCLAIWDPEDPDLGDRLAEHIRKAMRESKQISFWTRPNEDVEAAAIDFANAIVDAWRAAPPRQLDDLLACGNALIFAQVVLKAVMPGFPDIYRGSEAIFLALTDPDNRRAVDWPRLATLSGLDDLSARKADLTRLVLRLRREEAAFLARATARLAMSDNETILARRDGQRTLLAGLCTELPRGVEIIWRAAFGSRTAFLAWKGKNSNFQRLGPR